MIGASSPCSPPGPLATTGEWNPGDGRHPLRVRRGGPHREEAPDAVAGHRDRPVGHLGLRGQEAEVGVRVPLDLPAGEVRLDRGHQLAEDLRAGLFPDVPGEFDERDRPVPVEEVRRQHVVPVPRQLHDHLLQHGPQPEGVRVQQHRRMPLPVPGKGGEALGLAVGGGDPHGPGLAGHELSCRGTCVAAPRRAPGVQSVRGARPSRSSWEQAWARRPSPPGPVPGTPPAATPGPVGRPG